MAGGTVGGPTYFDTPIFNALVPKEGPKAMSISCPFSSTVSTVQANLLTTQMLRFMSLVQGVYVDNADNPADLVITIATLNQRVIIPGGAQAYLPLLVPVPTTLTIQSLGQIPVNIFLLNVPVPALLWFPYGDNADAQTMTTSQVSVGNTASLLLASNPNAKARIIVNNGGASVFLGGSGVTATTGLELPTGQSFNTSALGTFQGALYAITATGTNNVSIAELT